MLKKEIKVGSTYSAKISNKLARVRLVETARGGWNATNLDTGKPCHIKSAAKLRRCLDPKDETPTAPPAVVVTKAEYEGQEAAPVAPGATTTPEPATEPTPEEKPAKAKRTPKPKAEKAPRKASGLDLAAAALKHAKAPLDAGAITQAVLAAGWETKGKTPAATLYAAIVREITAKGDQARFAKTARGHFEYHEPKSA